MRLRVLFMGYVAAQCYVHPLILSDLSMLQRIQTCRFGGNTFASGFGAPTTAEAVTTSHNDPEISLWFKHLSKKDDSTKIKALNNLQSRVKDFSSEDAGEFVPPWLFSFKKLCTDNSRSVRAGAAKVLALVVQKAGKNAAPHLKELLGPLLLAMQDMYPEAGDQAVGLFEVCPKVQILRHLCVPWRLKSFT